MSFVSIANSLMSAFLLSYFLPSWRRGRFLINKERLFGNKERLLENKAGLLIGFFENISYLCSVIRKTNRRDGATRCSWPWNKYNTTKNNTL